MNSSLPNKSELTDALNRVKPHVHKTAVLTSVMINDIAGCEIYFKCENFQKMGAFKMRGAVNAILNLNEEQRARGVVTHSSGNFAQAVSLAAKNLNVNAHIVMPENAPVVKKMAVKGYGGEITISESTIAARALMAQEIIAKSGSSFLHPSNDLNVILGNATSAMELLNEEPDLNILIAPIGGGGLIAGTALAGHYFGNNCTTIGSEPLNVDDAFRSLESGVIQTQNYSSTIADGLRTHLGDVNFPIIQELVAEIIRVSEEEIIDAMRLIWERLKIVVEPSSAVPLAAILKKPTRFSGKKVGLIISGGNVDLRNLPF